MVKKGTSIKKFWTFENAYTYVTSSGVGDLFERTESAEGDEVWINITTSFPEA
jgi:hypothetical protein